MIKKGNLFSLVKVLDKSEKRYFRIHGSTSKSDSNYLRLFDFIDAQDSFDELLLKEKFEGEKFLHQLHVAKIYLTELILKALRNYYNGKSIYSQVINLLGDIEILYAKELYSLCRQKVKRAKYLCSAYEKESLLLEVLNWERKLNIAMSVEDRSNMKSLLDEEKVSLLKLQEINQYWDLTNRVMNKEGVKPILEKLKGKKPSSLRAQTLRFHLLYSYHFIGSNLMKGEQVISELISLLEEQPERIKEDPAPFVTALSNKIGLLLRQKRWSEIYPLIVRMRELATGFNLGGQSKFNIRLWLRIFNLELEVYRDTKQLARALDLIIEIEKFNEKNKQLVPPGYRLMLNYQIANIYFLRAEYAMSLHWVNQILNEKYAEIKNDLQCYARLLNLFIHFELDNIIVLRYAVDNTRRFIKKKKNSDPIVDRILKLFSILSLAVPTDYLNIMVKFEKEIHSTEYKDGLLFNDYIDIRYWIEIKIRTLSGNKKGKKE